MVDDEPRIRTMLRRYLVEEGFKVSDAADGSAMRAVARGRHVDLVLLDLMMPGEDGLSLARYIRQRSEIPIIMLTGKGDLIDRVAGLEAGADDYITKPFQLREVLARIRTVLRRAGPAPARRPAAEAGRRQASDGRDPGLPGLAARSGAARAQATRRRARCRSPRASSTCCASSRTTPTGCSAATQLMELVKGREWAAYDRAIDTQVVRLRKKIEADPGNPDLDQDRARRRLCLRDGGDEGLSAAAQPIEQLAQLGLELAHAVGLAEPCGVLQDRRPLLTTAGSA